MVHDLKTHGELISFKCPELKMKKSFAHEQHTDVGNFVVSALPELPSMNFTSPVHNRALLHHAVAVSPDPRRSAAWWASCAEGKRVEAGGGWQAARSQEHV